MFYKADWSKIPGVAYLKWVVILWMQHVLNHLGCCFTLIEFSQLWAFMSNVYCIPTLSMVAAFVFF
jgi:hypothetical protein